MPSGIDNDGICALVEAGAALAAIAESTAADNERNLFMTGLSGRAVLDASAVNLRNAVSQIRGGATTEFNARTELRKLWRGGRATMAELSALTLC
jgi:hypothetical protein